MVYIRCVYFIEFRVTKALKIISIVLNGVLYQVQ